MSEQALDKFGEAFIRLVRDLSMMECDKLVDGQMKPQQAQELFANLQPLTPTQVKALHDVIEEVITTTLGNVLLLFEQDESLHIVIDMGENQHVDLREVELGELQGYLYDWIPRFSKERYTPPA